jgi:hypothetical protein
MQHENRPFIPSAAKTNCSRIDLPDKAATHVPRINGCCPKNQMAIIVVTEFCLLNGTSPDLMSMCRNFSKSLMRHFCQAGTAVAGIDCPNLSSNVSKHVANWAGVFAVAAT